MGEARWPIATRSNLKPEKEVHIMRKLLALVTVLVAALALPAAASAGPHYVAPAGDPVCTFTAPTTVSCTGTEIAGVGNNNAEATLVVTASQTVFCHNPGNDNIVEPHTVTASAADSTGEIEPKNGRLIVPSVGPVTAALPSPATCPNPNWRAEEGPITVTFTYTLTIGGNVFFTTSGP